MALPWRPLTLALALVVGVLGPFVAARSGDEDECVVRFLADEAKASVEHDDADDADEGTEIGRFRASGGEGTLVERRFVLPGTRLFVFADVFYEDDLLYRNQLHDAMTLRLRVSASPNQEHAKWLAISAAHVEDQLGAIETGVAFPKGRRLLVVTMRCDRYPADGDGS